MIMLTVLAAAAVASPVQGDWSVDLRTDLSAKPYSQPMRLDVAADGKLTGTFYGGPIAEGRAATSNGRTCFAFNTADQSGPYHHAGCLRGAAIEGQSWSTGRNFLLAWRADRPTAEAAKPKPAKP